MRLMSLTRISLPEYTIRVWREESEDYVHQVQGVRHIEAWAHKEQNLSAEVLARRLYALPSVRKVEVLDWNGNGVVIEL